MYLNCQRWCHLGILTGAAGFVFLVGGAGLDLDFLGGDGFLFGMRLFLLRHIFLN